MMPWEDVTVQLVDTPPITADFMESYLHGLIRAADLVLLLVDLGSDSGIEQCQEVLDRLSTTKTRLARTSFLSDEDVGLFHTQTFLLPNKIDLPDAREKWPAVRDALKRAGHEHRLAISAATGENVARLVQA